MGKEGIDFSFRIHPVTAIGISAAIALVAFGAGRFSLDIPLLRYVVAPTPTPTSAAAGNDSLKDTAFTGTLQHSLATGKYYMTTYTAPEAIVLEVPGNINLENYVGKRILAMGKYDKTKRVLTIADAKSLEVLPKNPIVIPTIELTATPTATPVPSPTPSVVPTPEALPTTSPVP